MSSLHSFLFLMASVVGLLELSCGRSSGQNYDIDKTSPNGIYQVKIEVRAKPPKGTRDYTENARVQFFKGQEIIHAYEWEESDPFELSFHDSYPVIEWAADNVLHMGEDLSDQPFYDELIVSNKTDEHIKYLDVTYGRYEGFWVFDLAPRSQVTVRASPGFKSNGISVNDFIGYGGMTESGKKFHGDMVGKKRTSSAEGRLEFRIAVDAKDMQ